MKRKLFMTLLTAVMLTSCITVFAETDISFSQTGDKLTLSGTTDAEDASYVFVDIFPRGKYLDDDGNFDSALAYDALDDASDKNSVLVYTNQTEVKKGGYSFAIRFVRYPGLADSATVSGIYTAVVKCGEDELVKDILYVLPAERDDALSKLADFKDESAETRKALVCEFLITNKFTLGIYTDVFDSLTESELSDMLYNKTEEYAYSFGDGEAYIADLKKLVAVQTLNDGKTSDIDELKEELGLTGEIFGKWYTAEIVDNGFKASLTSKLSGKDIKSNDDFDKKLKEALTLTYNEKSDGVDDIKGIFDTFKGDFGITDSYSDDAFRYVSGESYSSFEALDDALDGYKPQTGGSSDSTRNNRDNVKVSSPVVSTTPVVTPSVPSGFADVPDSHWANTAVYALRDKGIISGKTQTSFCPDDNITREEFVKLVIAMTGIDTGAEAPPFKDIDASAWYAPYLGAAYRAGIIKGSSDGSFGTGGLITRQDIAVMLVRACDTVGAQLSSTVAKAEFADGSAIADYAADSVQKLQLAGVISGYTDGSVRPLGFATRAEAAQMIYKTMLLIK